VKQAVKRGLTKRLMERVGMGDSSDEEGDDGKRRKVKVKVKEGSEDDGDRDGDSTLEGGGVLENFNSTDGHNDVARDKGLIPRRRGRSKRWDRGQSDLEMGVLNDAKDTVEKGEDKGEGKEGKGRRTNFQLPVPNLNMSMVGLEQSMPADAVLAKEGAKEVKHFFSLFCCIVLSLSGIQFLQSFDPAVMPLGIITLEDVLEGASLSCNALFRLIQFLCRTYRRRDLR
jgi:metal transporter CNNM